ncbi:hypothetical protein GCM10009616_18120 [Microlunatus lacustris]
MADSRGNPPDPAADRHELWRSDQLVAAVVRLEDGRRYVTAWDGDRFVRVPRRFVTSAGARRWLQQHLGGVWFVRPAGTP